MGHHFRRFAEFECRGSSELYEMLALGVSNDDEVLRWFASVAGPRANANLLFAAVHFLLLGGGDGELASFYPTITPKARAAKDAYPAFRDFCLAHAGELTAIVDTRTTQTNEVGRCTYLLPALVAAGRFAKQPLFLIDVGTASGMNLLFDRYHYDYGNGLTRGPNDSPVRLRTELRAAVPELGPMPVIAGRVGIDLAPVDPDDPDATTWLRACVWPEHVERFRNLGAALNVVRQARPHVIAGNAIDVLPQVIQQAPADSTLVVMHTNVLPYFSPDERTRWGELLNEIGSERNLIWIGAEAAALLLAARGHVRTRPEDVRQAAIPLAMVRFTRGERISHELAMTGAHARWLEWYPPY